MSTVPESLQHLHGLMALHFARNRSLLENLIREHGGFNAAVSLEAATLSIQALRLAHGGDRLGSRGVYIQAIDERQSRRERIRDLMGPAPHSRKRARQVATLVNCSEITVWRAVREKETA